MGTVVCLPENVTRICGESIHWLILRSNLRQFPEPPAAVEKECLQRDTAVICKKAVRETVLVSGSESETSVQVSEKKDGGEDCLFRIPAPSSTESRIILEKVSPGESRGKMKKGFQSVLTMTTAEEVVETSTMTVTSRLVKTK